MTVEVFLQDEAIGHECAASLWQRRHKPDFARSHRQKARYTYNRWGATGKVEQLDLPESDNPESPWLPNGTTGVTSGQALDLSTLMKSSQGESRALRRRRGG